MFTDAHVSDPSEDDSRAHQSLASVMNDPSRGRGFWETLRESVEELSQTREDASSGMDAATLARIEALIGTVPETADFQQYVNSFSLQWDNYCKNHRTKNGKAIHGGCGSLEAASVSEVHSLVPRQYFRSDFKLEQHQIFRQSIQVSVEKQEDFNMELTGYLDHIEVALFDQIRQAQRDHLFDSLADMGQPLQQELHSTCSVVAGLRAKLKSVQQKQLRCGMAVGRLARRKKRMEEVLQRLDCLAHVQQSEPAIQMSLQVQDYVTALDLLESTKSAIDANLKGLKCVRSGCARLQEFGGIFDRSVEADFVQRSVETILDTSEHGASSSMSASNSLGGDERLKRLCSCLIRRDMLKSSLSAALRDVLLSQLKKALKNRIRSLLEQLTQSAVNQSKDGDEDGAMNGVATNGEEGAPPSEAVRQSDGLATSGISVALCGLNFDSFLTFWKSIMQDCVDVAERFREYAHVVHTTVDAETRSMNESECAGNTVEKKSAESEVAYELLRLFEVIMSSLIQKIGVFLQARQAEHTKLPTSNWQVLLASTEQPLDNVKHILEMCKRNLCPNDNSAVGEVRGGVKGILHIQTKLIIEEFHKKRKDKIQCILEQERWDRTDVPSNYKSILDQLISNGQVTQDRGEDAQAERFVRVDGLNFLVVPASLSLVHLLGEYVQLCKDFGSLAAEIVQRMTAILRLFNQQMQGLVLRAEAVSKQTLKKISAANLALASQCCGLFEHILPKLRTNLLEIFRGDGLPQGSSTSTHARQVGAALLDELSVVGNEFAEHKAKLFAKLSDLLRDRYDFHAKKWLFNPHPTIAGDLNWLEDGAEVVASEINLQPHEALDAFTKELASMYRILFKNLHGESVHWIFAKAFEEISGKFEHRLSQEIQTPSPPYEERVGCTFGDRLVLDLAFLQEQLSKNTVISSPVQRLLMDMLHHLRTKLPADDPLKLLHPTIVETLQRFERLPQ